MTPEFDEDADIQQMLEEARADSIAHGARLIEKYYYRIPVEEADTNDPSVMEALQAAAKGSVAVLFDEEGYEATEEPVVRVDQHLFGGEVIDLGNGRSVTYVAQIVATIRGFRR